MGSAVVDEAIGTIRDRSIGETETGEAGVPRAAETFGCLVFNDEVQQARLPAQARVARRRCASQARSPAATASRALSAAM